MTDSPQDNAGPFTMVYHLLAQEVGLVCAAVYGEVKRRSSASGICNASLETLGTAINLDRATVMRSIKKLCQLGYLIDQTPGRRNAPHTYIISRSVAECNSVEDGTVAENNTTVAENNTSTESVAQHNVTVAESYLNRIKKESKESTTKPNETGPLTHSLAKVCIINLETATKRQRNNISEVLSILVKANAVAEQVLEFGDWWKLNWRGKNGSPPLPSQVCDLWGEYQDWVSSGKNTNGKEPKVRITAF